MQAGAILISPQSRTRTWDVIRDGFGKDVESIDTALDSAFGTYNIDREHLAIGGFSDGASYALSLGLTNGQLFSHIIAFSPGFMVPGKKVGLFICVGLLLDATQRPTSLPLHCNMAHMPPAAGLGVRTHISTSSRPLQPPPTEP